VVLMSMCKYGNRRTDSFILLISAKKEPFPSGSIKGNEQDRKSIQTYKSRAITAYRTMRNWKNVVAATRVIQFPSRCLRQFELGSETQVKEKRENRLLCSFLTPLVVSCFFIIPICKMHRASLLMAWPSSRHDSAPQLCPPAADTTTLRLNFGTVGNKFQVSGESDWKTVVLNTTLFQLCS
jgi:hypothetical protein